MPRARAPSLRRLPDGSLLHNRLLAALPRAEYDRILPYVRMTTVTIGRTLHAHRARPFRNVVNLYAQANLLQIMQCTACNALHNVTQRTCRWLLQTQDRVENDTLALKQEFLAVMLGVQRPTVTVVLRALQQEKLISLRYGRIHVVQRKRLEAAACECYGVIRAPESGLISRPRRCLP